MPMKTDMLGQHLMLEQHWPGACGLCRLEAKNKTLRARIKKLEAKNKRLEVLADCFRAAAQVGNTGLINIAQTFDAPQNIRDMATESLGNIGRALDAGRKEASDDEGKT